jgi:putative flippase GtrA
MALIDTSNTISNRARSRSSRCYLAFNRIMHPTLANTIAYAVSFAFNYVASTRYTFKVKSTTRRGLSKVGNFLLLCLFLLLSHLLGIP